MVKRMKAAIMTELVMCLLLLLVYGSQNGYRPADAPGEGYHGEEEDTAEETKRIALTFDDGPHPVYTVTLLDGLKERGVPVSFFLIGSSIEGNEEIVRRMGEEGHLIGNHSRTHSQLTTKKVREAYEEITWTNQKIYDITGKTPEYIRPPFGSFNEELESMVPMTVALWSVDTLDWKTQNTARILRHILKNAEDGDIILLHDVYGTSVEAALQAVDILTERGWTFVTVDELLID